MKKIVVYIEKIEKKKSGFYNLILDFPVPTEDRNDFKDFLSAIMEERSLEGPSMLKIRNVKFEKANKPRAGLYYILPKELINGEIWVDENSSDEENQDVLFLADYSNKKPLHFGKAKPYSNFIYNLDETIPDNLDAIETTFKNLCENSKGLTLGVLDVGQGNMNMICFAPKSFIIYDIGSRKQTIIDSKFELFCDRYQRCCKFKRINKEEICSVRILMISHWDTDHYKGLLSFTKKEVDIFSLILIPNQLPTNTSKMAFDMISSGKIRTIPMRHRYPKRNATELEVYFKNDIFKFYKGSQHYNRNKTGLSLTAHYKNHDIIFTGDLHNDQIDKYLIKQCMGTDHYIVVPHHGGESGSPKYINNWRNLKKAIVSVGEREVSYQHPLPKIIKEYENIVGTQGIHQTVLFKDYVTTLI